ncbi:MAG: DUF192 domain-containing protein [Candidatus Undinarchaeales archaeon]
MKAVIKSGNRKIKCRVAETEWQKFKGLMLKKKIKPIMFVFNIEKRYPFHTFFMLKPIDLIFINANKQIVEKRTVKPWRPLIVPKKPIKYALELPEGEGKKLKEKQIKLSFPKAI